MRPQVLSTTQVDDKAPSVLFGVQKNDEILQSSLIEAVSVAPSLGRAYRRLPALGRLGIKIDLQGSQGGICQR